MTELRQFGILWVASPHKYSWLAVSLPLAPLLSALVRAGWPAARWGPSYWWGAAISATISVDQDAERSQPHSDGCASLRCPPVAPFLHATIRSTTPLVPMSSTVPIDLHGSPPLSYATFLLLRSGSYTSPVTHSRCNSTDSFRATAITARFLAFLPPRSQIRSPNRRKSLSLPCGPNM